jgi:hypothetical protein
MAATMPNAIRTANRNPIPRSIIGSLITSPRTPGHYRPINVDRPENDPDLMVVTAGYKNQATIHVLKLK